MPGPRSGRPGRTRSPPRCRAEPASLLSPRWRYWMRRNFSLNDGTPENPPLLTKLDVGRPARTDRLRSPRYPGVFVLKLLVPTTWASAIVLLAARRTRRPADSN